MNEPLMAGKEIRSKENAAEESEDFDDPEDYFDSVQIEGI